MLGEGRNKLQETMSLKRYKQREMRQKKIINVL